MRMIFCLAVIVVAVSFTTAQPPTPPCFDSDHDGVCFPNDCDDSNPYASAEDGIDDDVDGFTLCEGDCDDNDPTVHQCDHSMERLPPVSPYYTLPPDDCHKGFIVTTYVYNCGPYGVGECVLIYSYDTPYLSNCYPMG